MVTCQSHNLKIVGSIPISGKKQSFFIFWNIAKWQGVRFGTNIQRFKSFYSKNLF